MVTIALKAATWKEKMGKTIQMCDGSLKLQPQKREEERSSLYGLLKSSKW